MTSPTDRRDSAPNQIDSRRTETSNSIQQVYGDILLNRMEEMNVVDIRLNESLQKLQSIIYTLEKKKSRLSTVFSDVSQMFYDRDVLISQLKECRIRRNDIRDSLDEYLLHDSTYNSLLYADVNNQNFHAAFNLLQARRKALKQKQDSLEGNSDNLLTESLIKIIDILENVVAFRIYDKLLSEIILFRDSKVDHQQKQKQLIVFADALLPFLSNHFNNLFTRLITLYKEIIVKKFETLISSYFEALLDLLDPQSLYIFLPPSRHNSTQMYPKTTPNLGIFSSHGILRRFGIIKNLEKDSNDRNNVIIVPRRICNRFGADFLIEKVLASCLLLFFQNICWEDTVFKLFFHHNISSNNLTTKGSDFQAKFSVTDYCIAQDVVRDSLIKIIGMSFDLCGLILAAEVMRKIYELFPAEYTKHLLQMNAINESLIKRIENLMFLYFSTSNAETNRAYSHTDSNIKYLENLIISLAFLLSVSHFSKKFLSRLNIWLETILNDLLQSLSSSSDTSADGCHSVEKPKVTGNMHSSQMTNSMFVCEKLSTIIHNLSILERPQNSKIYSKIKRYLKMKIDEACIDIISNCFGDIVSMVSKYPLNQGINGSFEDQDSLCTAYENIVRFQSINWQSNIKILLASLNEMIPVNRDLRGMFHKHLVELLKDYLQSFISLGNVLGCEACEFSFDIDEFAQYFNLNSS